MKQKKTESVGELIGKFLVIKILARGGGGMKEISMKTIAKTPPPHKWR